MIDPMESFSKGVWLCCEFEKQEQETKHKESLAGLLGRATTKEEAKANPLPPSDTNNGITKLLDDWKSKYYHS